MNRFSWKPGDIVITKARDTAENKYNPSQPRDKDGQWSDGGGASKLLHNNTLPDYNTKAPSGYTILYTNTKEKHLDSILENGLKTGQKQVGYGASPEEGNVIWTDTRSPKSTAFGGNTIAFKVKTSLADSSKVNDTQHAIPSDVKPKDILFVDRVIQSNSGVKVSNLPEYVSKYGKEKTADVIGKTGTISREDTLQLIEMYEARGKNSLGNKTENYSPSQPRDKDGKWSDGGGGGFKGEASAGTSAPVGKSGKVRIVAGDSDGPGRGELKVTDKSLQYGLGSGYIEFDATPLERSLFSEHGVKLQLGTPNTNKAFKTYNGYYVPSKRELHLDVSKASDDNGRFDKTFYHELGHVVDHFKSNFKGDGHSRKMFAVRSKTNPYVIAKEAMVDKRLRDGIKSIYKIPENKMPDITEAHYSKLKSNEFTVIKTPGFKAPNGKEFIFPGFTKAQVTYYRSNSEVFAEVYAMSRVNPDGLASISKQVSDDFKQEYQQ